MSDQRWEMVAMRWLRPALHVCVVLLACAGAAALGVDLAFAWCAVMVVIVVTVVGVRLLPLGRWLGATGRVIERVGAGLGLLVVPVFALLGIDWLLALFGADPVSPAVGLVVGGLIVLVVARVSLEPFWTGSEIPIRHRWLLATGDVILLLVVPSVAIAMIGQLNGDGETLDQRPVVSTLDVVVLRSDPGPPASPAGTDGEWRIHVWTGVVSGTRIRWGPGGRPTVDAQANADRVLLLLPPRSDNGAVSRWMRLADRVEPRATPTYALLRDPRTAQLRVWRRPLSSVGGRTGDALALASLGSSRSSGAELGLRAEALSPSAGADLALAIAHRPVLLFDRREPVPRPLDVDELLATGDISMCEGGQKLRSHCVPIRGGDDLQTGFNHLAFDSRTLAAAHVATRIYVHVTHASPAAALGLAAPNLIYLDYWWYLPDNPAHSGSGAFCGPGFDIAGVTCFDHQSDWEGVTVILDAKRPTTAPVSVNYAEHDGSIRYSWSALERLWQTTGAAKLAPTESTALRPLVFSARGTHASYPVPCGEVSCPPTAVPGIRDTSALEDNPHDGAVAWAGDPDASCAGSCVAMLATRRGGTEPGSWNAWPGEWGTANCVMGIFCSSSDPPRSPGRQGRYEHPWCTGGAFDFVGGHFTGPGATPACAPETVTSGPFRPGNRLLALGDSYSSGEGAGDYEPATNTPADSCHRSPRAWPQLVADERRFVALPSLACSGATVTDVLAGRASGEAERRQSQISRIAGHPNVITITIGGNDLGFVSILEHCITLNCIHYYHRPNGDVLDARINALARRLPIVYRAIQTAVPHAKLMVVDYPMLFPESNPLRPTRNCAAASSITPAEGDYLNREVDRADVAILDSARQVGADTIDLSQALEDGELSCTGRQYLNHTNLELQLLSGSFHPNAEGQEQIASTVYNALAAL